MKFKNSRFSFTSAMLIVAGMWFFSVAATADSGAPDRRFAPPEPQPSGPVFDPNLFGGTGDPTTNSVTVTKIVITQSIQNGNQSVNIQDGRETFVRVFFDVSTARGWGQVSGKISVAKTGDTPVTVNDIQSVSIFDQWNGELEFKRNWKSTSLNFKLPATLAGAGTYTVEVLKVEDRYNNQANVTCTNCTTVTQQYTQEATAPLRLTVIGMTYATGGITYQPKQIDYNLISSWLLRAYPISQITYNTRIVASTNAWPFTCGQVNTQVAVIRAQDVNGGTDARTHYYGLVDDGGGFMRGCAQVPQTPTPSAIGSGPTGPGNWGWDFDGSYGDWYTAHELGHTLGRSHVGPACGATGTDPNYPFPDAQLSGPDDGYVGFDAGIPGNDKILRRALPGAPYVDTNTWHDVMSYCKYQWVSSYTYDALRTRIIAENALPSSGPAKNITSTDAHFVKEGDFMHIVATVNATKITGDIHAIHRIQRAARTDNATDSAKDSVLIRFSDASGNVLNEYSHDLLEFTDQPSGADRTGMIDTTFPFVPAIKRVDMLISGKIVATKTASANPPRVTARGKLLKTAPGLLQWQVEDADGDQTTSVVQVSLDGGSAWRTLAVGLKDQQFQLPPNMATDRNLKYRVTVSDGFHSIMEIVSP